MARNYTIVSRSRAEELVGGTRVQAVTEWGWVTEPSKVYAQIRVPLANQTAGEVASLLDYYSTALEVIAQEETTAGIVYFQDVNPAGQLIDELEITVQLPGTDLSGVVVAKMSDLGGTAIEARIIEELQLLRDAQAA